MEQDQQDEAVEPIQSDGDNQGHIRECETTQTSGPCNSRLGYESDSIQSSTSTESTSSTKKKGFSVYKSYKKAIKKLSKPPVRLLL